MSVNSGYETLAAVLQRALDQAQDGKGAERHADSKPFHEQPMQRLCELYGPGFALGQAAKKSQEALRLPTVQRQVAELLGAINYLAGAIIHLEGKPVAANDNAPTASEAFRSIFDAELGGRSHVHRHEHAHIKAEGTLPAAEYGCAKPCAACVSDGHCMARHATKDRTDG